MNHIHRLQAQVRALTAERDTYSEGINAIVRYLNSNKFSCGNELDGYVSVKDVLARLEEAKCASNWTADSYSDIYGKF